MLCKSRRHCVLQYGHNKNTLSEHTPTPTTLSFYRLSSASNTLLQYPLKCIFSPSAAISSISSLASRNVGNAAIYPLNRASLALVVTATISWSTHQRSATAASETAYFFASAAYTASQGPGRARVTAVRGPYAATAMPRS